MDIDDDQFLGRRQTVYQDQLVPLGSLLQPRSAKEQTFRICILATNDALFESRQALSKNEQSHSRIKEVRGWWSCRVQKGVQFGINRRRVGPRLRIDEIAIQIDIVFIDAAQPCH